MSGEQICRKGEKNYPESLVCFDDMPDILYWKGHLPNPDKPSVAIVGARMCSHYGSVWAYHFAKELASCGVQIISGMAAGIDGWAHRGALDAKGITFAVLGCGLDICYPSKNRKLYEEIPEQGGLLSEYMPKDAPLAWHFPRRNRIISALADLVLVIEAKQKSGSLITAQYALEQGKAVYALPGRVGDALSEGCNHLIFDGAGIANSVEILLQELSISEKLRNDFPMESNIGLASREEMVYSCLDLSPKHLEEILSEVQLDFIELKEVLLKLELEGYIEEPVKNYYAKMGGKNGKISSDCGITCKSENDKEISGNKL